MALNFSHRAVFPGEDNLVSPMRMGNGCHVDGVMDRNGDRRVQPWLSDGDVKDCFDYGRDRYDRDSCSQDSVSKDILDLLPTDPFGMDINSTFTAITGWLEDLETGYGYGGYGGDVFGTKEGDFQLFAGWNLIWNNAMSFQGFPGITGFNSSSQVVNELGGGNGVKGFRGGSAHVRHGSMYGFHGCPVPEAPRDRSSLVDFTSPSSSFGGVSGAEELHGISCGDDFGRTSGYSNSFDDTMVADSCKSSVVESTSSFGGFSEVKELTCHDAFGSGDFGLCTENSGVGTLAYSHGFYCTNNFTRVDSGSSGNTSDNVGDCLKESDGCSTDGDDGVPHAALNFAVGYLGVRDLLNVERVCRTLCSVVRDDPLLWRNFHIGQPLNERITDELLQQLTARAQGALECLSLVKCTKITDDGLRHVLENNPGITKLCVPGCIRLSIGGILQSLRMLKSRGTLSLKHIRIGGLYGVTEQHFAELRILLGMDSHEQQIARKPRFYNRENLYLNCDDDRYIDIELCPRCLQLRLVYDCPAEVCQDNKNTIQSCRACTLCIVRCVLCGRCINDGEYEETFCLDVLCSDCSKQQFEKPDEVRDGDGASLDTAVSSEVGIPRCG